MAKRYDYKVEWEVGGTEWRKNDYTFDTLARAIEHAEWLKERPGPFRNVVIYRRPRPDWEVIG